MKNTKLQWAGLLAFVVVFSFGFNAHAATPSVFISVTPKNQGENQFTYLKSLNVSTGKTTSLRSFLNESTIMPNWISGSLVTFKKGEDLYVGRTYSAASDRRIAHFTTCKLDSSCMINPVGISPNGRYVGYSYEHPYIFDRWTGKTTKLADDKWFSEFSQTGKYLIRYGIKTNSPTIEGLYVTPLSTMKSRFIQLTTNSTYIGTEKISPDDKYLVWTTGGSTDSNSGVTQPTQMTLNNIASGKKINTVPLRGGTVDFAWTSPTSLITIQSSGLDPNQTYDVYAIYIIKGQLRGGRIASFSNRRVNQVGRLNSSGVFVWGANNDTYSYWTMTNTGKQSKVTTISNPNEDWYQFVK